MQRARYIDRTQVKGRREKRCLTLNLTLWYVIVNPQSKLNADRTPSSMAPLPLPLSLSLAVAAAVALAEEQTLKFEATRDNLR